jgi:alanine-synthesizing transaminase
MSQKKSVIFKNLLPVIKQYQQAGFTHEKIVALLRDEHHLDLVTTETFKSYLYRYAPTTKPEALQEDIEKALTAEHFPHPTRN